MIQYPAEQRPSRSNVLISGRYDMLFHDPEWPELLPCDEPLCGWLAEQLTAYGLATVEEQ